MSSQQEQSKLEVKFLDDSPVSNDELELHINIAKTIKRIIELTQNRSKKIIGLFGSWGSGKSTVVKILEKDLGNNKIFIFDSWSHRGDFLKRAFLIELAKYFDIFYLKYKEETKKGEKYLLSIGDILTSKIVNKYVNSTSQIKLDKWIKILTIFILLAIIINPFINFLPFLFKLLHFIFSISIKWLLFLSISLLSFALVLKTIQCKFIQKINNFIERFISFYMMRKIDLTESHLTKEDLEFTNYDYEEYLDYILKQAKEVNKLNENSPFIVVFDNLDRVDDETVLNTLSLIQLTNEVIKDSKFKNIYFLIPIDKERLEKTIKTIIAGDSNNKKEKVKFAKDFLEKIFTYKVEIPDINHSDWRKFFKEKFQEAFGEYIDEEKILIIRRLFEKSINISGMVLTPRVIKIFINNLVENYIYWNDEISINSQTLYVLLNNYLSDGFKDYIKNTGKKAQKKGGSITDVETLIRYFENECPNEKVIDNLLKQFYKVHEIYILFIEPFIKAIETKSIDEINKNINILKKNKVEILIDEVWEKKEEDFNKNINLLLGLSYSLKNSNFKTKFKNLYNNIYKTKILPTLKILVEDTDKLVNLDTSNLEELKDILEENDNLKKQFIEQSVEIMTIIPKEKNNEK